MKLFLYRTNFLRDIKGLVWAIPSQRRWDSDQWTIPSVSWHQVSMCTRVVRSDFKKSHFISCLQLRGVGYVLHTKDSLWFQFQWRYSVKGLRTFFDLLSCSRGISWLVYRNLKATLFHISFRSSVQTLSAGCYQKGQGIWLHWYLWVQCQQQASRFFSASSSWINLVGDWNAILNPKIDQRRS